MTADAHIKAALILREMRVAPLPVTGHYPNYVPGPVVKWVLIHTLENFHDRLPTIQELAFLTYWDEATCATAMRQLLTARFIVAAPGGYDVNLDHVIFCAELHDEYLSNRKRQKEVEQEQRAQIQGGQLTPPTRWTAYDFALSERPLPAAGVYAFYCDGALTYIGSSVNVRTRTKGHRFVYTGGIFSTPWGQCYRLYIKVAYSRSELDWLTREAKLIARLKPRGNQRIISRRKSGAQTAK